MKTLKYFISAVVLISVVWSCTDDEFGSLDFLDSAVAPSNIIAVFGVAQDNSGTVQISPNSDGAVSYQVYFGDDTVEPSEVKQGESIEHVYPEGSYNVKIEAIGVTGLKAENTIPLEVSFNAPENLEVIIENDPTISKQVNITVNADFAINFDVYFGEGGVTEPLSANIGETISYNYTEAGTYNIKVDVKGAAIESTEYTQEFEVTEILQPLAAAPNPGARAAIDVISLYSDNFTAETVDAFVTGWSNVGLQEEVSINGNQTLVYRELSFAGIITESSPINASGMEYFHFDVWTTDVATFKTKFVDFNGTGYNGGIDNIEFEVQTAIAEQGQWVSVDIPLSDYQGVPFTDINQMVIAADPVGTVFIDNMYFWREATTPVAGVLPLDFEVPYALSSFDGGAISIVDNPDMNGNNSSKVVELVKGAGQPWAGSKITADTPYSIQELTVVTAKVWSPRSGLNLLMKFEDATPWPNTLATAEITATTTVANGWEELSFTLTGVDGSVDYNNLVLIMDNGTNGDGSANFTIYIDDISVKSYFDFEDKYALSSFDGGAISRISNPDMNGNPSENVLELVKGAGQPWAGSKITVNDPFAIDEGVTIKAKVWSPRAGLNLLMKFEDATPWPNTQATAEITATTTMANAWEELTFVITGVDGSVDYNNIVLIMDNGTNGDGSANYTIYVDDISKN